MGGKGDRVLLPALVRHLIDGGGVGEGIEEMSLMGGEGGGSSESTAGNEAQPVLLGQFEKLSFATDGRAPAIDLEPQPRGQLRVPLDQVFGESGITGDDPTAGKGTEDFEIVVRYRQVVSSRAGF